MQAFDSTPFPEAVFGELLLTERLVIAELVKMLAKVFRNVLLSSGAIDIFISKKLCREIRLVELYPQRQTSVDGLSNSIHRFIVFRFAM